MRPTISEFVRIQTYPTLKDHISVTKYPRVKGVIQDVVFIDHAIAEDGAKDKNIDDGHSKTKSNTHEADICVEMVRFFLLQGYQQDQIVVLTPYVGQLMKIAIKLKMDIKETTAYVSDQDLQEMEEEEAVNTKDTGGRHGEKLKSIRCATIDNFQGEESDIFIIALVGSNKTGNIGSLKKKSKG